MTADVLVKQDAKASATMIPTRFSNIQDSVGDQFVQAPRQR